MRILSVVITLLLGLPALSLADTTGQISGTVTDPSGSYVSGASVIATETNTGITHKVETDAHGAYSLVQLPAGQYDLTIQSPGFTTYEKTGIVVDVNSAIRADVALTVGSVTERLTVAADPVEVETENTQIGDVIQTRKLEALPLNGRNYTDLLGLQPGVVPVGTGSGSGGGPSPAPGTVSVSGGREDANGFQVNGGNVEYAQTHGAAIVPNLDSISEFRLLTNGFQAEFGQFSGGMINAITKSGTNDFHGSAFDFLRNNVLDARNFYDVEKGTYRRNQFGGTVGGRIIRDKLFFFGDYQGTRALQGLSTGIVTVPTQDERNGIISDPAANLTGTVGGTYWAQTLSQRLGYPVTNGESYYIPGCASSGASSMAPDSSIQISRSSRIRASMSEYLRSSELSSSTPSTMPISLIPMGA